MLDVGCWILDVGPILQTATGPPTSNIYHPTSRRTVSDAKIRFAWKTRFTAYEPPLLFEDEQAEGPYALWRHRHSFEEVDDGTVISDRVEYALPLGPLGRLAQFLVARQLRGIFAYRQRALMQLLGGDASLYGFSPVVIMTI